MSRGFTLLEVMISLAILAVALVALSDLNGSAVQMHAYGRRATTATLLVQSKMLDLEELLQKEGPRDFDDERHGTFEGEAPGYSWRAEILRPDVKLDETALLGMLGMGPSSKGGSSADGGTASPLATAGPFAGLMQGQAKTFIETLKKSVRELRVTVIWMDGKAERSVSASQQIVILPEMVGKAGQTQPQLPGRTQ
ncbi:MAG TPA: prepilin-type N-terminal cleavage/methylation domain-containing protein [Myxococcales bacterium]|nr:prepilin-type N-terminal cleavage/methylation domain-containing protein [Myxococcales bacterium]